jgi:hypothetical protein
MLLSSYVLFFKILVFEWFLQSYIVFQIPTLKFELLAFNVSFC